MESQFADQSLPQATYDLRNWFNGESTGEFKKRRLESYTKTTGLPFLLVGDNTESDPQVLSEFIATHPEHTIQAYIHVVTEKTIPSQLTRYYTAFDLALFEFEAGRLTASDVVQVAHEVLDPEKNSNLFPDFAICPKDYALPETPRADQNSILSELKQQVTQSIVGLCAARAQITEN